MYVELLLSQHHNQNYTMVFKQNFDYGRSHCPKIALSNPTYEQETHAKRYVWNHWFAHIMRSM